MNKQIAIDILEKEKAYMQQHAGKAQVEAFDMAICALKISEQEIRNKVIDEFAKKIKEATYQWFKTGTIAVGMIDEIAEQIKQTQQTHECD